MLSVRRCSMTEAMGSRAGPAALALGTASRLQQQQQHQQQMLQQQQQQQQQLLSTATPAADTVHMYLLDKAFLRILEPYGLGNEPVTFQTIVQFLKKHVVSRGLFDVSRPDMIICAGDPLGAVFKKGSFTSREAVDLIRRHICPVFTQKRHDVDSPMCTKPDVAHVLDGVSDDNKVSSSEEESDGSDTLAVEFAFSEPSSSSSSDLSLFEEFQENSKVIVNMSPPSGSLSDAGSVEDPEDRTAASVVSILTEYNEFEPFSELGSDDDLESFSSDSDLEIHIVEENIMVESVGYTEEDEFFADSSDADVGHAASLECTVSSPWFCKCPSEETKSSKGFCHACWTAQFGWRKEDDRRVPPSVQRRKRAKRDCRDPQRGLADSILPGGGAKRPCIDRIESAIASSDSSSSSSPLEASSEYGGQSSQGECSTVSTASYSSTSAVEPRGAVSASAVAAAAASSVMPDMLGSCIMCESRARNTALVHGRSAHIIACYKCSRKLQEKGLKCPHCRRIVERVVRLYL